MPRCNPERKADLALVQKYDPSRHDWQIRDYIEEMGVRAKDLDLAFAAHREAAIAQERPVPVYFIGVGERVEDLETFNAREFAQALLA